MDSMEAVKLLPWCVTVALPFHYMGGSGGYCCLTGRGHPLYVRTTPYRALKPRVMWPSPAPGPCRVLTSPPGTSPPLVSFIPDIPLSGTALVGQPFPFLSMTSSQEKGRTILPVVHLTILKLRGPMSPLPKLRWGVSIAPHRETTIHPA